MFCVSCSDAGGCAVSKRARCYFDPQPHKGVNVTPVGTIMFDDDGLSVIVCDYHRADMLSRDSTAVFKPFETEVVEGRGTKYPQVVHYRWVCSCGSKGIRLIFRESVVALSVQHLQERHNIPPKSPTKDQRIAELERQLQVVRDHICGLPFHPWIPGAAFDEELRKVLL